MRVVSTAFTTLALAVIFHTDLTDLTDIFYLTDFTDLTDIFYLTDLTDLTDIFYLTDFSDIVANPPYACQPNLCDL